MGPGVRGAWAEVGVSGLWKGLGLKIRGLGKERILRGRVKTCGKGGRAGSWGCRWLNTE